MARVEVQGSGSAHRPGGRPPRDPGAPLPHALTDLARPRRRGPLARPGPWIGLLGLLLFAVALDGPRRDRETHAAAPETGADSEAELADFATRLGAFRAGDDGALPELRAGAARLAVMLGREDLPRVVDYYAALDGAARAEGLDAHDEVDRFHERSIATPGIPWPEARRELLEDLSAFVDRRLAAPDFVPAANALALRAELLVEWAEDAPQDPEETLEARLDAAERDAREALAVLERAGMETPRLRPLLQLGKLARLRGDDAEARRRLEACEALAERSRVDGYREEALVGLARLARDAGDLPRLDAALAELASFTDPETCWPLAREHALRLIHADRAARAAEFLVRHRPADPADLSAWRQTLALARVRLGEFEAARELLARGAAGDDEDERLLRATLDLRQGDTAAVLSALVEEHRLLARTPRGRSFAAALVGEAHLVEGRPAEALRYLSRARELAETREARLVEESPLATSGATVIGEWLGLHAVALEARALAELGRELEAAVLIERAHGDRWRASARGDRIGGDGDAGEGALDARDLRAWAERHEHGLVTWIIGADEGLAVHVLPDGRAVARRVGLSRRTLERAVRRLRSALLDGAPAARLEELSDPLVRALLPDSLRLDGADDAGRLLLAAHGPLERLPFEALVVDGRPLDALATLLVLPELPARRPGEAPAAPGPWTLAGAPLDTAGRARLARAGEELVVLGALLPGAEVAAGAALTREAVTRALERGRSLHLATHLVRAERCRDERFSDHALELSGGELLCAAELAELDVRSPLVVLAACETAEGRGLDARGTQGVARALLDAGVRDLVVTLWPIRDDVARDFAPLLHRALAAGEAPSRAVRRARRALAARGVPAADWAAFRLLGRD